jgi:hypothetical protein
MITQLLTSACETLYDVDGKVLRLWIIVGGTPAVAFTNYSFTQRYPVVEKWSQKNWSDKDIKYAHQDKSNIQGPTFDVLPNGEASLYEYLKETTPLKKLREQRRSELPYVCSIKSTRFHDKDNRCYFHCELRINDRGISPVTASSSCYAGRCEHEIQKYASQWWKDAVNLFNPIFDKGHSNYEELSEEDFQTIKRFLTTPH